MNAKKLLVALAGLFGINIGKKELAKEPIPARKSRPRTSDGSRRKDKVEYGDKQWLRRYHDRYAGR